MPQPRQARLEHAGRVYKASVANPGSSSGTSAAGSSGDTGSGSLFRRPRTSKHAESRIDWFDAQSNTTTNKHHGNHSHVYVITTTARSGRTFTYCGSSSKSPEDRLKQHNSGSCKTTRRHGKGRKHELVVTGFNNYIAASRFEALVKMRGSAKGPGPKINAAVREVNRHPGELQCTEHLRHHAKDL